MKPEERICNFIDAIDQAIDNLDDMDVEGHIRWSCFREMATTHLIGYRREGEGFIKNSESQTKK